MSRDPRPSHAIGATVPTTMRTRTRPTLLSTLAAIALVLCSASAAFAQALVVVEVRTPAGAPADGQVTLMRKDDGRTFSCTTRAGTCRIEGVPGGLYMAILTPSRGQRPPTRQVMIPPGGTATLRVSTR